MTYTQGSQALFHLVKQFGFVELGQWTGAQRYWYLEQEIQIERTRSDGM